MAGNRKVRGRSGGFERAPGLALLCALALICFPGRQSVLTALSCESGLLTWVGSG